ncbi:MAG: acylphosphatase [Kiritimatiellia bacterium]|nr:acylphosphatase [Kiritimatiellia bacterium]
MSVRVHLKISGIVQGVCFRYYCREQAKKLGLKGFVRNNADGSVETAAEGEDESIKNFIVWCRQGPPAARVRLCEDNYEPPTGEFDTFVIGF